MDNGKASWLIAVLVVAAGAVALWYFRTDRAPVPAEPARQPPPAEEPEDAGPRGPRYPLPADDEAEAAGRELRPLPALDESDEYFKLDLVDLFGRKAGDAIVSNSLIERLVATIDNLPRQRVSERIRPLTPLEEPFLAEAGEGADTYTLDEQNYRRYDALVERFTTADADALVDLYRRYYPLFQKAYEAQGYPDAYFNDRLVDVIDHLLATPDVEEPIRLVRPHVLYEFADPGLEELSGGQKLMLRLGPANRERVKERLSELRALIADAPASERQGE